LRKEEIMVNWPVKVWVSDCSGDKPVELILTLMLSGRFLRNAKEEIESRNWDRVRDLLGWCDEFWDQLGDEQSPYIGDEDWEQIRSDLFGFE